MITWKVLTPDELIPNDNIVAFGSSPKARYTIHSCDLKGRTYYWVYNETDLKVHEGRFYGSIDKVITEIE